MLSVTQLSGLGAGGPKYYANSVNFDGTNDYLTRGADLTGNANSKLGTFSCWVNLKGGNATLVRLYDLDLATPRFSVLRQADDTWRVNARDTGATLTLQMDSNSTYTDASGWHHILMSWDTASASHLWVDDSDDEAAGTTLVDAAIDYTDTDHSIGAVPDGTQKISADIADLWFTNDFIDISSQSNRRLFIDSFGKPVFLGASGQIPTGTDPLVFFSGPTADWHTNLGSGLGFTENGVLTDGADSPSD